MCVSCRVEKPSSDFSNRSLKRASTSHKLLLCKLCMQCPDTASMSVDDAKKVQMEHQTMMAKYCATNGQMTGKKHYPHKGSGAKFAPRLTKKIKDGAKIATAGFVDTFVIKTCRLDDLHNILVQQAVSTAHQAVADGAFADNLTPDYIIVAKRKAEAYANQLRAVLEKLHKYNARPSP